MGDKETGEGETRLRKRCKGERKVRKEDGT